MALGPATFTAIGGAVGDLFNADALRTKAAGGRIEAQEYDLAGGLARQNKQYTETSTELKQYQADRAPSRTSGCTDRRACTGRATMTRGSPHWRSR